MDQITKDTAQSIMEGGDKKVIHSLLTRKFPDHCVALKNTGHVMNPTQAVVNSSSHKD